MSNWVDIGESDSSFQSANVRYIGNGSNYIEVLGSSKYVILYDISEFLKVGECYKFSFTLPTTDGVNNVALNSCQILFTLTSFDDYPNVQEQVFEVLVNSDNKSKFLGKTTTYEFTYTQGYANTCLALYIAPDDDVNNYNYLQLYLNNIKLERVVPESEKMLDGILGWLQELWNSIVDGFSDLGSSISSLGTMLTDKLNNVKNTITEKLGVVITSLTGVLNGVKEGITTKLGEINTYLTGEIRMLGDRIINYLLYFSSEVPENPFKTEDGPLTKVQGYIDNIVEYINNFTEDMDDVIDSVSAGITIFRDFVQENKWIMILVAVSLFLIVVGRFVGI